MLPLISRSSLSGRAGRAGRLLLGVVGTLVALALGLPSLAGATSVSATATSFYGPPLSATLTIDDGIDPGKLVITLTVDPGANTADLRAFYAQIADESLIDGLYVSGTDVTGSLFAMNAVSEVGVGTGVPASHSPCLCDFGVAFGDPSAGVDDLQSVTFTLAHMDVDLTVDLFADQGFAVRANSVAPPTDGRRKGSAGKLSGLVVVPEPTVAALMLLGLAGLSSVGKQRRSD